MTDPAAPDIEQDARRWLAAVNIWGQAGQWLVHSCKDPQMLEHKLERMLSSAMRPQNETSMPGRWLLPPLVSSR